MSSTLFKGEVTETMIEEILTYCKDNLIAEGWMGQFGITPSMRDNLIATSIPFKSMIELIPYICRDTINVLTKKILIEISQKDLERIDMDRIKISLAILSKQMEFIYKTEKDSGLLKDVGENRRKRTGDRETDEISMGEIEDLESLITK